MTNSVNQLRKRHFTEYRNTWLSLILACVLFYQRKSVEGIPQQIVNVKSVPRFQFSYRNDVHVNHDASVVFLLFSIARGENACERTLRCEIVFAYAVFHHMVSCWIVSFFSSDSLANVCHNS